MCVYIFFLPQRRTKRNRQITQQSLTHTHIYIYISIRENLRLKTAVILGGVNGLDRPRNLLEVNLSWKTTWFLTTPLFLRCSHIRSLYVNGGNYCVSWFLQWIFPHVINFQYTTLPKTNIAPENRPSQKENTVFQPSFLRAILVLRNIKCFKMF